MKNIAIVGAAKHGEVILGSLEKCEEYKILGFIDATKEKDTTHYGYKVLGSELDLPKLIKEHHLDGGILAIENNWLRMKMAEKLNSIVPNFKFITIIHSSAIIGRNVKIGKGSIIMPGVIINANSTIGKFCHVNANSSIGHDSTMKDFSSIASGVCTGGNLELGTYSSILLGAKLIENITIGEHSIVGAGSLVVKNISSLSVAYGSPAIVVEDRKLGKLSKK
ncbi:acetyltransferase [Arenibacter latericius]|uniref:acetyltransferase n=1 Tax=Arenibacter latericius TaxID=86104 RepID=UPI000411682F|nr:acetyltransferase [Arenibacter latericius]MDX1363472.1 acetyltransferase [Arenibacter latericius]